MNVTLDVPGMSEPATGRLISIPEFGRPPLNDVFLRHGRWPDAARADEVLASEMFCESHGLTPGHRIGAIINGRRRELTIVGVALSPEYVYAIAPGEMFPDPRRFGIFWMNRRGLAAAFDMEGAFNEVSVRTTDDVSEPNVIAAIDRLLEPYGGRGATPRSLQMSAWTLENELAQLQTFGLLVPAIFLGVAAFVLPARRAADEGGQVAERVRQGEHDAHARAAVDRPSPGHAESARRRPGHFRRRRLRGATAAQPVDLSGGYGRTVSRAIRAVP